MSGPVQRRHAPIPPAMNQPHTHNIPPSQSNVDQVAQNTLRSRGREVAPKPGLLSRVKQKVINAGVNACVNIMLPEKEDKRKLNAVFKNPENILAELQTFTQDPIRQFIEQFFDHPAIQDNLDKILLHLFVNLTYAKLSVGEKNLIDSGAELPILQKKDADKFLVLILEDVITMISQEIETIENQNISITPEQFKPLAKQLLDLILPPQDSLRKWVPEKFVSKSISEKLHHYYSPISKWLKGETVGVIPTPVEHPNSSLNVPEVLIHKIKTLLKSMPSVIQLIGDKVMHQMMKRDQRVLRAIFTDADHITEELHHAAPHIVTLLEQIAPEIAPFFKGSEYILDGLMLHLIVNLALARLSPDDREQALQGHAIGEMFTVKAFIPEITLHLATLLGEELNKIDAELLHTSNAEAKQKLFDPLSEKLLELLLPPDDGFRILSQNVLSDAELKTLISKQLLTFYTPISNWLTQGQRSEVSMPSIPSDLEKDIQRLGVFAIEAFCDVYLPRDQAFFRKLTNSEDIEKAVKSTAILLKNLYFGHTQDLIQKERLRELIPATVMQVIDEHPELATQVMEAMILRASTCIAEEVFADNIRDGYVVPSDLVLQKIISHGAGLIKNEFENLQHTYGEDIEPAALDGLAFKLTKLAMPKENYLEAFTARHKTRLLAPFSQILFELYHAQKGSSKLEEYKQRLEEVIGEREAVDQIHRLCSQIAAGVRHNFAEQFGKQQDVLAQLKEWGLGKDATTDPHLNMLVNAIQNLAQENDSNISWIGNQTQYMIELTLFKGLTHLLEKVSPENRDHPESLAKEAFSIVLKCAAEHLKEEKLSEIRNAPTDEKRYEITYKAMQGFVEEMIGNLFEDENTHFKDHLPIPEALKEPLSNMIKEKAADFMAKAFLATTSWILEDQQNKQKLEEFYPGSQSPEEACHLLAGLSTSGIQYVCREQTPALARMVTDMAKPYLVSKKNNEPSMIIHQLVSGLILQLGDYRSNEVMYIMKGINSFVESVLLHELVNISDLIQQNEKERQNAPNDMPSLLEEIVLQGIQRLEEHLGEIAVVKKELKTTKAKRIKRDVLIAHFRDKNILHEAVEVKNEPGAKRDQFVQKLSTQFLEFLGFTEEEVMTKSDFPLPLIFRKSLWQAFEKEIFPSILIALLDQMKDPTNLNQALVSLLNSLIEQKDPHNLNQDLISRLLNSFGYSTKTQEVSSKNKKHTDKYQADLQRDLGNLARNVVDQQPTWILHLVMKFKRLREKAGEAVGEPLRGQLRPADGKPLSLLTILNLGTDVLVREFEASEKGNFKDVFPQDEKDKRDYEIRIKNMQENLKKEAPKALKKIVLTRSNQMMEDLYHRLWDSIQKHVEKLIEKIFRRYAPLAKKIMIPIVKLFVGLPLRLILTLFRYMVWIPIKQMLNFYLNFQSKARAEDIEIDIHDNLLYHLVADLVQSLKRTNQPDMPATNPS